MVDDYNHFMNSVDIANQLQAKFTTKQKEHYELWYYYFTTYWIQLSAMPICC